MAVEYISGCRAAAEAARLADVDVVAAYPITPQTSIVEYLAQFVADGHLRAQMIPVESEHSAMSACVGAAMVGARAFTATASQGLALMHEVLFWAAGLRTPIVMVVANRSLAAPVTIFADHQDSLAQRDSGWLQFYVESCQEILDSVLIAYKVAEDQRVLLPAMISMEGFVLSHVSEPVDVPDPEQVAAFLPKESPQYPTLDVDDPKIFNVMAFPRFYEEFVRDKQIGMMRALDVLEEAYAEFEGHFGRRYHDVEAYRVDDAEIILVAMGTTAGTTSMVVDELRERGEKIGLVKVRTYRPFPGQRVAELLGQAKAIGVLDRDISLGTTGILYQDVVSSLYNLSKRPLAQNFIVGLGGRDINRQTIIKVAEVLTETARRGDVSRSIIWPDENRELLRVWGLVS